VLTLCGPAGVGKTMLARAIFNELGWDAWRNLSAIPQRLLVNGTSRTLANRSASFRDWRKVSDAFKGGEWSLVEAMEQPLLLCVDDVGADYDPNLVAASKLDRILRSRRDKWTVVTCNLGLDQIAEKMDPRIASYLIRDGNTVVEMNTKDWWLR
jgi:DNA replication protein DnaC